MRKLLFFFFVIVIAINTATAQNICDLINESCSAHLSTSYTVSGGTSGSSSDDTTINVANVVSVLKKIVKPAEGVYITKISVDGFAYEHRYRYYLSDGVTCSSSYTSTKFFGEHYNMMYNSEKVGDCYYYGREDGFDIYCTWDLDKYANIPAGEAITASKVNRWYYYDLRECSFYQEVVPKQYGSWSFDNSLFNNKVYLQGYNAGFVTASINQLTLGNGATITVFYQMSNNINISYCYCEGAYHMYWETNSPVTVTYKSESGDLATKSSYSADYVKFSVPFWLEVDIGGDYPPLTYDLNSQLTECSAIAEGAAGGAVIKVKGNGGIFIKNFKVVVNNTTEIIADNFKADVSAYIGETVTVDVYPLYNPILRETHSLTVNVGENIINLDSYYYSVELRAYYKDFLGNLKPISFNWQVSGDLKPDKVNTVGTFAIGGTGFQNYTLTLPAGEYTVNFSANILGFDKSDSQSLTLLDSNYYKYVTFIASLTSTEIQNGSSTSAILQVIVNDQYGKEVNNATVKVYDGSNTLIANQFTHDGQAIVGGLQIGSSYKIEVWVGQTKKAEKSITITEASQTVIITINLNEQEEEYLSGGGDTAFGGGTGGAITGEDTHTVAQNIVLSIFKSYGFWGLVILISITVLAAANGGERIGLLTFVAGLGVLTFVIPLLPQAIFVVVAIIAFILFGWQAVDKITGRS